METSSSSSPPSSIPTPSSMAPPAGQPSGLSKMQQEPTAAPDGPPIEAVAASIKSTASSSSSSSRAITIPQSRDSIYLRRDKDVVPVHPVSRTDSTDSWASHFRSRRTDTSWSSMTQSTAITEPPSPDDEHFHDDAVISEETYASSPRPFGNPGRTVTFHQDNCRPAPYSSSPDNTPLPRHSGISRLQDRSSSPRRGILRSSTGLNPIRPSPAARRGSNHWPAPLAYRPRLSRHTIQESAEDTKELPTPTEPSDPVPRFEEPPQITMIRQIEQVATIEDVGLSSLSVEDTQTAEPVSEEMSDASDSAGDVGTPTSSASGSRPDDQIVHDTCDHVLKNVFGVDLQELGVTGAASAAYDSVHYCLDELWHLVPSDSSAGQSSLAIRQVPNDYGNTRGGGHAPIRPGNGGEANNFYPGGGSSGGSGGQKRPNGDGDQGDQGRQNGNGGSKRPPGDRDGGGGGGKRTKVSPEEPTHDQKLSCPFRKRNPVKFNVRDHQSCAVQSFPDISQLKRHVKNFHKQRTVSPFACPRCKQDMLNSEGLQNHLGVPNESICTPQEAPPVQNPEDGITSRIEDVLNGRKANTKIDTWEVLWPTLFPLDRDIPDSHFVPPVELEEVQFQFKNSMEDLESRIRQMEHNEFGQSLDNRVARIVEECRLHIKEVIDSCRAQADNAPGRPRRNRSHNHGQNPKSAGKGKSPETQGSGSGSSSQHLTTPEASQPLVIPKKEGQRTSLNESNLSSSFGTADSDESWVHTQAGGQDVITTMATATFDQYPDLNIDTNDSIHTQIADGPLSAATTGPAGSPDHLVSPQNGHVIPPPPAHLRNMFGNGFQVSSNGSQGQSPVNVLDSQLHNRTDSAVSGLDATPNTTYFQPSPTFANTNNMAPAFMTGAMGYASHPVPRLAHAQQLQQMQHQLGLQNMHNMQVAFRHPGQHHQAVAAQHQQLPPTIDPRVIDSRGGPIMEFGQVYGAFSPGGSNGMN